MFKETWKPLDVTLLDALNLLTRHLGMASSVFINTLQLIHSEGSRSFEAIYDV